MAIFLEKNSKKFSRPYSVELFLNCFWQNSEISPKKIKITAWKLSGKLHFILSEVTSFSYHLTFTFFTLCSLLLTLYLPAPPRLSPPLSLRGRTRHSLSASSQMQRWLLQPLSTAQEVSEEDENSKKKKRRKC